jgi:hypothetical protein
MSGEDITADFNITYDDTSEVTWPYSVPNGSTDVCPANTTLRIFGQTEIIPRATGVYIALAVCHMFLIAIPAVVLSSLAMFILVKKSLSRHPTSLVFFWICVICFLGPSTYGLLMDFSLIFDVPLLGRCERQWEGMILWLSYACATTAYDFLLGFNAITFYVSLRWNIRRFNLLKLNLILVGVLVLSIVVASLFLVIAESQVVFSCKIRGSFCVTSFGGKKAAAIALEVIRVAAAVLPVNISVGISLFLYIKRVRKNVVQADATILHSLIRLFVVLALGGLLWNGPTLLVHFSSFDGSQRSFVEMLSTFTLQQNFSLLPLLVLSMHKEVRESFMAGLRPWEWMRRRPAVATDLQLDTAGATQSMSLGHSLAVVQLQGMRKQPFQAGDARNLSFRCEKAAI